MDCSESRKRVSGSAPHKYMYGIILREGKIDFAAKGVYGSDVYCLPHCEIGAIISDISDLELEIAEENILAQERVVEAMMENAPILPMRFGTIVDGEEKVLAMLKNYYHDFVENLQRVRGKVELGVKILWEPIAVREEIIHLNHKIKTIRQTLEKLSPSKRYLQEKLEGHLIETATQGRADALVTNIHARLKRCAEDSCLRKMVSPKMILNASYLVLRERVDDFRKEFQSVRKQHRRLAFLYSGPWPPYSFITVKAQEKILSVEE